MNHFWGQLPRSHVTLVINLLDPTLGLANQMERGLETGHFATVGNFFSPDTYAIVKSRLRPPLNKTSYIQ